MGKARIVRYLILILCKYIIDGEIYFYTLVIPVFHCKVHFKTLLKERLSFTYTANGNRQIQV